MSEEKRDSSSTAGTLPNGQYEVGENTIAFNRVNDEAAFWEQMKKMPESMQKLAAEFPITTEFRVETPNGSLSLYILGYGRDGERIMLAPFRPGSVPDALLMLSAVPVPVKLIRQHVVGMRTVDRDGNESPLMSSKGFGQSQ